MKRKWFAFVLMIALSISQLPMTASADPAPYPTATATFHMDEYWWNSYWGSAENKYEITDRLEFAAVTPDDFVYVSIIGDTFRIRSTSGKPTIYSKELTYQTSITRGSQYIGFTTAYITPDGTLKDKSGKEGIYTYRSTFYSNYGIYNSIQITGWKDALPPSTTAKAVWQKDYQYIEFWSLTLEAKDDHSGVKLTEFRIYGGDWLPYKEPVALVIHGETILLEYRSTDKDGNVEPVRSKQLTPPKNPY